MARVRNFDGTLKLSICKRGKTELEDERNWEEHVIENDMCLFVGTTGSGKTVAKLRRTYTFFKNGYTCISLTEKRRNPFESLMMAIPPKQDYHLSLLRMQGEAPMTREQLKDMLKVWHPTFLPDISNKDGKDTHEKVFKKKHFPINWFSYPIRMKEEVLMSILTGTADTQTVQVSKRVIDGLKPNEDLWDMVDKISSEILNKKYSFFYNPNYMGADVGMMGNRRTVETIANSFSVFNEYYFFQPEDFLLEFQTKAGTQKVHLFDFKGILTILNDNKHIHQISTAYIRDNRVKYVVILNFLFIMADAIERDLVKHPIYLSFDEIRNLLPKLGKEETESFKKILATTIGDLLRELRNTGFGVTSDLFTQDFNKTNTEITGSVNKIHLMPISENDKKVFIRDFEWNKSRIDNLEKLQTGETILLQELANHEGERFLIAMPPFAVPEESLKCVDEFAKEYPEKMETYSDLFKQLSLHKKGVDDKVITRLKDKQMKRMQEEEFKEKEKETSIRDRIQKEMTEEKEKNSKKDEKAKLMQQCYEYKKANLEFPDIAKKVGVSDPTARTYCYKHAVLVKDHDFLRREGKEFMIQEGGA